MAMGCGSLATVQSLVQLLSGDRGFDPERRVLARIEHGGALTQSAPAVGEPDRELIEQSRRIDVAIRSLPGIADVGIATDLPVGTQLSGDPFWLDLGVHEGGTWAVGADTLRALGARFLSGRGIEYGDVELNAPVVVASAMAARLLVPGKSPSEAVGQWVPTPSGTRQVVGVVADIRPHPGLAQSPALSLPIGSPGVQAVRFLALGNR